MKHLLLILPLAACAPHVDPCRFDMENPHCVEMDRADHRAFLDHNPHHGVDGDDNGSGSASSDAVSDDSNGDGSDD
jgi:hypothetical protein